TREQGEGSWHRRRRVTGTPGRRPDGPKEGGGRCRKRNGPEIQGKSQPGGGEGTAKTAARPFAEGRPWSGGRPARHSRGRRDDLDLRARGQAGERRPAH